MKVEINQTINPEMVTLYSHRTGEFIDEIPAGKVKELQHLSGGGFQVTRKQINKIKREQNSTTMTYQEFEEKRWGKGDLIVFRNHRREVIGVNFESGWIQTRTRYTRRKVWVYYGDCETVPFGAQHEER